VAVAERVAVVDPVAGGAGAEVGLVVVVAAADREHGGVGVRGQAGLGEGDPPRREVGRGDGGRAADGAGGGARRVGEVELLAAERAADRVVVAVAERVAVVDPVAGGAGAEVGLVVVVAAADREHGAVGVRGQAGLGEGDPPRREVGAGDGGRAADGAGGGARRVGEVELLAAERAADRVVVAVAERVAVVDPVAGGAGAEVGLVVVVAAADREHGGVGVRGQAGLGAGHAPLPAVGAGDGGRAADGA